ncbi:phage tail protein [Bacteroides pyogenes]|uniref:phage tail protein n=1 Tax=Bacteroides pyogenes TaxID=310300 RepID=UPI001BABF868|nr:phage tail protein [Bacteroides pyogenes]MBR8725541.1 hypothetical protein [Bacteroides pyogenes]MBR8737678.1 hypothetical protein [Bacteroides pyogenes]MBR8753276.1 hypothetical protein [Bacteroides pyogenes]MBR8794698.1 hypothetical protein [Bacteroides pyogenes]
MGTNLANIIITQPNGNRVPMQNRRTATGVVSAKQNWALNAEDTVDITVESPFPQAYNIGDRITIFGRDYKLNRLPSVKKTGMHAFQYTLQFEGVQYDLFRVTYDLTIDTTTNELQDIQGDSLTGNLHRLMTVLVANANRVFPGKWKLGACPDTIGDKTLTFGESDNCLSVLQNLCGESNFNVEFDIVQADGVYTINLYERVGQTLPYTFEYGKGRGLYDLNRQNVSSANIVTRLKVYGSTENITSKYRADRLCLPGRTKGQSYIEKAEMVAKYGIFEGRKNFDDVKPTFTGSVESKVDEFSFIDTKFPFDLNAKNAQGETLYLMNGVAAKIHFNTGNLAGYDFEVKAYDHATHKFTLKKFTDDRGSVFPSETSVAFQFSAENKDEYKVLDIAYSQDIEAAAEERLAEVGNKYYDQNCQPKVQYGLSVTKAYLERLVGTSDSITNFFAPGDYLHVVDADIDVDKAIRIKSFVRNILDPYEYILTISDTVTSASITNRVISDLVELDKIVTINNLKDPVRARANWRSSREVLDMVFDPDGDYYTDKIKPNSIDTMALSVGAKSMQFGLMNTVFQPNFQGNNNVVKWQGGVLTHYTINEESAVSWVMADAQATLTSDVPYYLYAKCEKAGTAGSFIFTTSQIKVDEDANYYHFLVGTLSSIDPELKARSLALTYGFTMINGRFIKTGRIESADGTTYFDLDNSEIGGRIVFASNGEQKTLEQLGAESLESKDFINNTLPGLLSEIQAQLDGQIEQFFDTYDPTLDNAPASEWTTSELKENHLGDLFYNTDTGKVFRFIKNGNTYSWQELRDSEVAQALAIANDALKLAGTKRRIFTSTPYTPYEVGDLWVQGASGDIMRCKTARVSGSYSSGDWGKASKYTDDSGLNDFINSSYNSDIADILGQIDGKVECWFQTTDPASSWTTIAVKKKHVGDMWYHTSKNELKYYTNSYAWKKVEDAKAIAAYEAASQAQDTADSKRRVFVVTPYPPYEVGDLWVDGKELRRCITKKTSSQSYNVNDWDIAVYYDNTQTTIDGGIVTSGIIQVAGDNQSILAGMTGQGTTASSVRFWAGAPFDNRATAPFRVLQDGSVVMTKATVEGVINAISGYIGGFKIQQGQIGYGSSSEQDSTQGLALLRDFIRFYNGSQRVLLGCLNSLGYPFNGLMELTGTMGTVLELHHKYAKTSDEQYETLYRPKALGVYGNQFNIGNVAFFERGYIGVAYSDAIVSYIGITHKFLFTGTGTSFIGVNLPTKSDIDTLTDNEVVQFDIEIVCDHIMPNKVRIYSKSGAYIYNNDGKAISDGINMEKGDVLRLRYYNGAWNKVYYHN